MKKIMLVAGLLFCSQTIFAQLEKGMIAVGLTSTFTTVKNENESNTPSSSSTNNYTTKSTTYNVAPTVSYFLTNRFAVGLSIGYAGYNTVSENTSNDLTLNTQEFNYTKTISSGVSISPYVKYYFPLGDNFHFLVKGGFNTIFSNGKTNGYTEETLFASNGNVLFRTRSDEYGPNETKTTDIGIGISPGILFMPGKKIGLEFSLGNLLAYNSRIAKTTNNTGGGTTKATTGGLQLFNFNTVAVGTGVYYFF